MIVALAAPFCYGVETNYLALRGTHGLKPIQVLGGASVAAFLLIAPLTAWRGDWMPLFIPWTSAQWALIAMIVLHIGAYSAYVWLVTRAGSVFASQVAYVVTLTGVLWSMRLLSESYSGWIWGALGAMLIGIALTRPKQKDNGPL